MPSTHRRFAARDPDDLEPWWPRSTGLRKARDTLGGVFEVAGLRRPPGLGSHVHYDRKLDARLAAALMSIQSVKGVEVGDGFATAARPGSKAHDEIVCAAAGSPATARPAASRAA